jgi:Protein of unknown function (DUF4240)
VSTMPTAAEESRFWSLIESAWVGVAEGDLDAFHDRLQALSAELSAEELTVMDRVIERKLYDLDRADVHAVLDGSNDKFLYRRGFVVAMGWDYYEAVRADPQAVTENGAFEEMCYFFAHLCEERFGEWPDTGSGISRETCGNEAGWLGR